MCLNAAFCINHDDRLYRPSRHRDTIPHRCQGATTECYLVCGKHWHVLQTAYRWSFSKTVKYSHLTDIFTCQWLTFTFICKQTTRARGTRLLTSSCQSHVQPAAVMSFDRAQKIRPDLSPPKEFCPSPTQAQHYDNILAHFRWKRKNKKITKCKIKLNWIAYSYFHSLQSEPPSQHAAALATFNKPHAYVVTVDNWILTCSWTNYIPVSTFFFTSTIFCVPTL